MESEKSESDTRFMIALIENRVKEVGIAALDFRGASLHLSQFIETSRSYQNTVTLLQYFDPKIIILSTNNAAPDGMIGLAALVGRCTSARKVELVRGCFDDTKGAIMLQNLAAKETSAIFSENYHKQFYLCLGAAAAVLKWIEVDQGYVITKSSLQVTFNGSFDHMSIDATSVQNLEVIEPLVLDSHKQKIKRGSLYNMLNTTNTVGGARLLRANLLQPLKDIETINTRLDCLDELTNNEQLFIGLSDVIQKFPKDTDRVLCSFCFRQKNVNGDPRASTRRTQALVAAIILLKEALDLLPVLSEILQDAKCSLLCNIRDSLSSCSGYSILRQRIAEVISDDAMHARSAFAARTQQCFAVKYGVDIMLDISRKTFCMTSEAIHGLGIKYQKELDLPKLRLIYNQRHGFHIVIPEADLQKKRLPKLFVQVVKRGKKISSTTDELMSLNNRNREAAAECYIRTEQCLEDLTNHIREDVRYLALLAESLSLLDMMVNSFANMVITKLPAAYTRPDFTENGPIAIEAGRHPVLESIHSEEFVPNNTFMSEGTNLVIVTGPNMSGKSTYLRQVALITIMAHIGCYVPAGFASFRIVDHIFTRIGTGDNLELNASTFMTEMRETAFILQNISDRSLILVDELGRGTSTSDGLAIAWSCSEYLLSLKAYSIFATHMERLAELSSIYPNVKTCYLSASIIDKRLEFKYMLREGQANCPHYGLLLAEISGFPGTALENARKVTASLQEKVQQERVRVRRGQLQSYPQQKDYHVAQRLLCLQHTKMTEANLRNYLQNLKDGYLRGDI